MNVSDFWRDDTDMWCNHCPSCGTIRRFTAKISVYDLKSVCRACDRKRRGCKTPGIADLISDGKIWFDESIKRWKSNCPLCGRIKTSGSKDAARRYLDSICHHCTAIKINTGRKHTEETKRKRSLALKGEKSPCYGTHLSDEVKRKMSQTTRGIPKSPEHFDKIQQSCFKRKEYVFPDGRVEKVQGYEPLTLNHLLFIDFVSAADIAVRTKDKPVIAYEYDGYKHNYFPDCYIKSTNTIVETKSMYTWENKLEQNNIKVSASVKQGFNMRVLIWDKDNNLVRDIFHQFHPTS
jgi:hypothetical protein